MTGSAPIPFDLAGPLPTGTTVLEASAGTGKTYAIVSLAVRYIADGIPISRLLMATFSNAASAELRDRTRSRLREAVVALDDPAAAAAGDDKLHRLLATGSADDIALRRARIVVALSDFDSATMATTHTFCNRMLAALGFLGEREQQFPIVENVDELVADVARDLYIRKFAGAPDDSLDFKVAETIAKDAVRNPVATLAPTPADGKPIAESTRLRIRFAEAVRATTAERKRLARVRTYDDLQGTLHHIVTDEHVGEQARRRIREQFDVVLIDEFQDTDPQQWEIVERCFHDVPDAESDASGPSSASVTLILVGDPKQSIYAFRGAEVLSYLNAVEIAGNRQILTTNFRSDEDVVHGVGTLFADATLGHPMIAVHPVDARHKGSRLSGAPAVRVRAFTRRDFTLHTKDGSTPLVPGVRDKVIADVAADIAAQLAAGITLDVDGEQRPIQPGDIAILLRFNKTIEPLQHALTELGIASVVRSGTSIFQTSAARHWWYVLQAMEQPARVTRVRMAALTPILGFDAASLDAQGDAGVGELSGELAQSARVFAEGGFAAMSARLMHQRRTHERVLASENGERLLTDLLQVSALCNRHVAETSCGLSGLVAWLGEHISDDSKWSQHAEATRRLDRDTQAVQIMTIHGSKGLEFPIVYVPFGWDGARQMKPTTFVYHEGSEKRFLDVGGQSAAGFAKRWAANTAENAGEDLRLLYVAMTRARSQLVLWWAPSTTTRPGPLHRLLFTNAERTAAARSGVVSPIAESVEIPDDRQCVQTLRDLAARDPMITIEQAGKHGEQPRWKSDDAGSSAPTLSVSVFDRRIDQDWRRTSYSAITAAAHAAHGAAVVNSGSEPEEGQIVDEPVPTAVDGEDYVSSAGDPTDRRVLSDGAGDPTDRRVATTSPRVGAYRDAATSSTDATTAVPAQTPSLMNGLPFGAAFGTLVHEVLENVDTSSSDMDRHVREQVTEGAHRRGFVVDTAQLTSALIGVLTTPLGLGDGSATLWDVSPRDRLSEMDFEIPLSDTGGGFSLGQVADLLDRHLAVDDPLRSFADVVRTVNDDRFHGYLTGSIDSVLRTDVGYVVVDYKTNRLMPGDLVVEDFTQETMAQEMIRENYPLQALLYSVALHRYLRWRLPGYDPAVHLGPVQYHFVRGMAGPQTPSGCGVFEWRIPSTLVVELSDLLAGKVSAHV
ncbi:UvrD-helicase domain-containing protein [Gordonia sp. TBRC 11910]|uniref:RecBCD enzyme subunit RecB n=1 Tax=Gordonia asplenii TaxID=2725283 RepID=A0A848KNS7_9ACTN|nr:UvrD-helicase domain-containing protein [Gordonia asplenii]NMO00336.1 UvrD-helicase domain-containing protein [Gordonia asplenii]